MYSVAVKDHIMIAHSLKDEYFGPAKNLHGATYVIEESFFLYQGSTTIDSQKRKR